VKGFPLEVLQSGPSHSFPHLCSATFFHNLQRLIQPQKGRLPSRALSCSFFFPPTSLRSPSLLTAEFHCFQANSSPLSCPPHCFLRTPTVSLSPRLVFPLPFRLTSPSRTKFVAFSPLYHSIGDFCVHHRPPLLLCSSRSFQFGRMSMVISRCPLTLISSIFHGFLFLLLVRFFCVISSRFSPPLTYS